MYSCMISEYVCYNRYVYWGEYPLCFAACRSQEECYRLILARGADPDSQDTNGNTVLHMLVIYEKMVGNKSDKYLVLRSFISEI